MVENYQSYCQICFPQFRLKNEVKLMKEIEVEKQRKMLNSNWELYFSTQFFLEDDRGRISREEKKIKTVENVRCFKKGKRNVVVVGIECSLSLPFF